jgi:tol-pal system protein YbgF
MTNDVQPKSAIPSPACMALFLSIFFLVQLPACSWFKPGKDPRVAVLQQELDRIAKSNSATQQKVEEIYNHVFVLQAKADTLEATLDELVGRPVPKSQITEPPVEALEAPAPNGDVEPPETRVEIEPAPLSPESEYEPAYEAYTKQHFDKAMTLFRKFLQHYPEHDLADNARYWIGEIYYDTNDYPNAILAFKEVVTRYPERSKAPDALLKAGYSYVALDDPVTARIYFVKVIKDYPFSEAEAKARAKLKELEKWNRPSSSGSL